jgi:hypothetical protein
MKKITHIGKFHLLSLCLFLALGLFLTSCHETEVNTIDDNPDATACQNQASRLSSRMDFNTVPALLLYTGFEFSGQSEIYTIPNGQNTMSSVATQNGSMIIPPNRNVTLNTKNGPENYTTDDKPMYVSDIFSGSTFNFILSISVSIKNQSLPPVELCAVAYKEPCWEGAAFPFFSNAEVNFASDAPSWNNQITSVASNDHSSCPGLMVYDDADADPSDGYTHIHPDRDATFAVDVNNINTSGIENNSVSRVLASPRFVHNFERVNFPIGAVIYGRTNFQANSALSILPKGYDGVFFQTIKSYAIAPNTTVDFYKNGTTTGTRTAGYRYNESGLSLTNSITLTSDNNTENDNDYFGIACTGNSFTGRKVPLFLGMSFSPENNTNWPSGVTIKSIKTNKNSRAQGLIIDDLDDDFPEKLLSRLGDFPSFPTSISTNRKLSVTPFSLIDNTNSTNTTTAIENEGITYEELMLADWKTQMDFYHSPDHTKLNITQAQLNKLCTNVLDKCSNDRTNGVDSQLFFDEAVTVGLPAGAAIYYSFFRSRLGLAAAQAYVRIRFALLTVPDITEHEIFMSFLNGLKGTATQVARIAEDSGVEMTTYNITTTITDNSTSLINSSATNFTEFPSARTGLRLRRVANSSHVEAVGAEMDEETGALILDIAETAETAAAAATEASGVVEVLTAAAALEPVGAAIIAISFVTYEGVRIYRDKVNQSAHTNCEAINQTCRTDGFNSQVTIIP